MTKEERKEYNKKYYQANKEELTAVAKKWYNENAERHKETNRKHRVKRKFLARFGK